LKDINDFTISFIDQVRAHYDDEFIPLHRPVFDELEKTYLNDCIDSNFVSSAGQQINEFEGKIAAFTNSKFAKSTVNGTAALHLALHVTGVGAGHEVITQRVSFVATANAIRYCNAEPVFLDVERETGTMCPLLLRTFLQNQTKKEADYRVNIRSGRRVSACVVMHTFGHPAKMLELASICDEFNIILIEDAAEALGSYSDSEHVGRYASLTTYSFNGNKIITTGGGGCITTNDNKLSEKISHLSTTAKAPDKFEYFHDQLGFNYRMPNINACLGLAQFEKLDDILANKRSLAEMYTNFFADSGHRFWTERSDCRANYWLNAVSFQTREQKQFFLETTNAAGIMTRPVWVLLDQLPHYSRCETVETGASEAIYDTTVNIPSSAQ
jgi:perosamine synthetase